MRILFGLARFVSAFVLLSVAVIVVSGVFSLLTVWVTNARWFTGNEFHSNVPFIWESKSLAFAGEVWRVTIILGFVPAVISAAIAAGNRLTTLARTGLAAAIGPVACIYPSSYALGLLFPTRIGWPIGWLMLILLALLGTAGFFLSLRLLQHSGRYWTWVWPT